MRLFVVIMLFLISSLNIACATNNVSKLDFERLFFGDIINPQNYIKPIGMALIGDFSGAILENDKNEQFFVMQGDEINLADYWSRIGYRLGPREFYGLLVYLCLCLESEKLAFDDSLVSKILRWQEISEAKALPIL